MAITLTTKQIQAAVLVYINANLTVSTTIQWPGRTVDKQSINDWIEVWITSIRRIKQRRNSTEKDRRRATILVKCFAKRTTTAYRVVDIVKDVADVLEHAEIVIRDYDDIEQQVGRMRLSVPTRRNTTLDFNKPERTDVRVWEVRIPAYIQGD